MQLCKRLLVSMLSVCLCLSLFACASGDVEPGIGAETGSTDGAGDSDGTTETPDRGDETETGGNDTEKKILIAYFSATGNTERVAAYIINKTGGIGYEIAPAVPSTLPP